MLTKRENRMKKLQGVVICLAAFSMVGCLDMVRDDNASLPSSRLSPVGEYEAPSSDYKGACLTGAPVVIFRASMTCPAWRHPSLVCSNRIELTLQGNYPTVHPDPDNRFELTKGVDYEVCTVDSLAAGIPSSAKVVIIESNHLGIATAGSWERSPTAQTNLSDFADAGGTVVVHLAGNAPAGLGYLAPGLSGPVTEDGDSNTLTLEAGDSVLLRGPDESLGTADDLSGANIAWLGGTFAHHGSLTGILPPDAKVLMRGAGGKPIYAEYEWGFGRFIVSSLTFEFGEDINLGSTHIGFGQTNRLVMNHLYHALNRPDPDKDGDGVKQSMDCDDNDSLILERLHGDNFNRNNGFFHETTQLGGDPWAYAEGVVMATGASQQALIGPSQSWDNVVIRTKISSGGTFGGCCVQGATHRWRAGIVGHATLDEDQDEGFHGIRCALASNAQPLDGIPHGGASTGQFVQIGKFLDAEEDEIGSECEGGLNTTFDELARTNYDAFDFNDGREVQLSFWLVGNSLHCEAFDGVTKVSAHAYDNEFTSGTVGLSTLNMFGQFNDIEVCRTNVSP